MNKLIILLCIATVLAAGQQNQPWKSSIRNKLLKDASSDSDESNSKFQNVVSQQNVTNLADLPSHAVWQDWSETNTALPWNAVFGGWHERTVHFVIRAEHTHNSVNVGEVTGFYDPIRREGFISYEGRIFRKPVFSLLLHSRPVWADKLDSRPRIFNHRDQICRAVVNNGNSRVIGTLDVNRRICKAWFGTTEIETDNYEVLAVSCTPTRMNVDESLQMKVKESGNMEPSKNFEALNNPINVDEVWQSWNVNQLNIPRNAVFGGYDQSGPYFIIRGEYIHHGIRYIRNAGYFNPFLKQAVVLGQHRVEIQDFQLLLHESHRFTPRTIGGTAIRASSLSEYCQHLYFGIHLFPGRYTTREPRECNLFFPRDLTVNDFNVLRRAC